MKQTFQHLSRFLLLLVILTFVVIAPVFAKNKSGVIITSPKNKLTTYKDTVVLQGKTAPFKKLFVNNVLLQADDKGRLKANLKLHAGKNYLEIWNEAGTILKQIKILRLITFDDVSVLIKNKPHWAKKQLENLATLNIVEGYPDGTFVTANNISRGELATWLARGANIKTETSSDDVFMDVPGNHWRAPYIRAMVDNNDMTGFADGTFGIDDNISRLDTAIIIGKILKLKLPKRIKKSPFMDIKANDPNAPLLFTLHKFGLMISAQPKKAIFAGKENFTRAMATIALSRFPFVKKQVKYLRNFSLGYSDKKYCIVSAAPEIVSAFSKPAIIVLKDNPSLVIKVTIDDPGGLSNISSVKIDLTSIGGPNDAALRDDGLSGDEAANDGIYSLVYIIPPNAALGDKELPLVITNKSGWSTDGKIRISIE